jgi:hypothetical protein
MLVHPERWASIARQMLLTMTVLSTTASLASTQTGPQRRGWRAAPTAAIKIHAPSGTLLVQGWGRDSVSIEGTLASGESLFGGGTVNGLKLGVEGTATAGRTSLIVRVPAAARLVIRSGAADVEVIGLTSTIDVGSAAGNVDLSGDTDAVTAESISGDVHIAVNAPVVRARTTRGRLDIAGRILEAQLTSVSGAITLSAQPVGTVRVETVDGAVNIRGAIAKTGSIDVQTFGGTVDVELPAAQGAALDLRATNGSIVGLLTDTRSERGILDLQAIAESRGNTVSLARVIGPVGAPAPSVTIRTMRGRIRFRTLPR